MALSKVYQRRSGGSGSAGGRLHVSKKATPKHEVIMEHHPDSNEANIRYGSILFVAVIHTSTSAMLLLIQTPGIKSTSLRAEESAVSKAA